MTVRTHAKAFQWPSIVGAALLAPRVALCFTPGPHSLHDTQELSSVVIEGHVISYRHVPHEEDSGWTFTEYTVRVDESLKGSVAADVAVRVPGGPVASGRVLIVPGAPYLEIGSHVLLHLAPGGDSGSYFVASWTNGVLREVDGLALVGADERALVEWGCQGNLDGELASMFATQRDSSEVEPEGGVSAPSAEAIGWDDAVQVVRDCLSEVAQ